MIGWSPLRRPNGGIHPWLPGIEIVACGPLCEVSFGFFAGAVDADLTGQDQGAEGLDARNNPDAHNRQLSRVAMSGDGGDRQFAGRPTC